MNRHKPVPPLDQQSHRPHHPPRLPNKNSPWGVAAATATPMEATSTISQCVSAPLVGGQADELLRPIGAQGNEEGAKPAVGTAVGTTSETPTG